MSTNYKFIPEISPNQRNWQVKVIVAEKLAPKQAKHGNSRYQNMILMDLKVNINSFNVYSYFCKQYILYNLINFLFYPLSQGNKVYTTLYDGNITAFEDQLLLSKTYVISNALVKETKPEYRASNGDVQWIISGKTRVEELNENNMEFLFSTYTFTPFDQLDKYMDCDNDISISYTRS